MDRKQHRFARGAAVALAGLLAIGCTPALAGQACSGGYNTSTMQTVPLPMTVSFASAPENPAIASRFTAAMQAAGALVNPSSPLQLNLLFTISTPANGPQQGTVYNNFNWASQRGSFADLGASTVSLTAQVMDTNSYGYVWIASIQCVVQGNDAGAVADELGNLVGRTLGREITNGRM